jgi:hypothetical protein
MAQLEDLTSGTTVSGIIPGQFVTVIAVQWFDSNAIELTYQETNGSTRQELIYRDREAELAIAQISASDFIRWWRGWIRGIYES